MIRMIQVKSLGHAEDYFKDSLAQTDYYINGQELGGRFNGQIAKRLKIEGRAAREVFHDLCNNNIPGTLQNLTQRTPENRTVFYDINFHVPKSVSIAYLIHNDTDILSAFQESVKETMLDMEADAQTRVRKKGGNENRPTGELLWADFTHLTARPVDDKVFPDPHLHCHCTTFNVTYDKAEQMYKAGQFRDINRDMPYYQERYYKRLADRLINIGYNIRLTPTAFELEGIPQVVIDLFSKRTQDVNRIAKEKNITSDKQRDKLGAKTRAKKQKDLSIIELKHDWRRQIAELGLTGTSGSLKQPKKQKHLPTVQECIDHALAQSFERASVAQDRRLLAKAYRFSLGYPSLSLQQLSDEFTNDPRIIQVKDGSKLMCTTKEVLAEEQKMVSLAKAGQGQFVPLYHQLPHLDIEGDQAEAVRHILTTTDQVALVRGGAGTGKTTTLKELVKHVNKIGIAPVLVAPTASASRGVMRDEGFETADTVAKLLIDRDLQNRIKNGMLVVDEAGLLGVKDMLDILQLAKKNMARLVLVGDTRQHSSVVRGDALRILNTVAGIKVAEINKIYRQRQSTYRKAVEDLSKGNVQAAFARLDSFQAITEMPREDINAQLVNDYMLAIEKDKTALIISPTHQACEEISDDIRTALQTKGMIGKENHTCPRHINLNYTEAEKSDARLYQPGFAVHFHQNLKGIVAGSIWDVESIEETTVSIEHNGKRDILPMDKVSCFSVYRKALIQLSLGDTVVVTRGSLDVGKKRLNNGQQFKIAEINSDTITLNNPTNGLKYAVGKDFGHLRHGYATTSHASQGRTVDAVFIAQPASTFAASNLKQFYVSVSRAREQIHIYTEDKHELLAQVSEIGNRQSAIELLNPDEFTQLINTWPQPLATKPKSLVEIATHDKPIQKVKHHVLKPI